MPVIKDHHRLKCNTEMTSPSPVTTWEPGTAVNGGLTVDLRAGVGSEFVGSIFVGVICDACFRATASQDGKLTAYCPEVPGVPAGLNLVNGNEPPVIVPPTEG